MKKNCSRVPVYVKDGGKIVFIRTITNGNTKPITEETVTTRRKMVLRRDDMTAQAVYEVGICILSLKGTVKRKATKRYYKKRHRDHRAEQGRRNNPQKSRRFEKIKRARRRSCKN